MAKPLTQKQKIKAILAEVHEWESLDKDSFLKELLPLLSEKQINDIHERQVLLR